MEAAERVLPVNYVLKVHGGNTVASSLCIVLSRFYKLIPLVTVNHTSVDVEGGRGWRL